jgi:predicted O-methyltransferase YrrM
LLTTKPKFIIDAGAFVGYALVLFGYQYPDAKIIAVKSEVKNFNLFKKTPKHIQM